MFINSPNLKNQALEECPIVLVGLMGCGKSSIGKKLAQELGLDFFDSDDEITLSAGQSIPDLFEYYGEKSFRDLEKRVLTRLLKRKRAVVATGGGAVTQRETLDLLKKKAILCWLNADVETMVERTSRRLESRPLLVGKDPRIVLAELLEARLPMYSQAHLHVDANGPAHDTVKMIVNLRDQIIDERNHAE